MTCYQLAPGNKKVNNAGLPDGIAIRQGCQIVWLDAQIHAQLFTMLLFFTLRRSGFCARTKRGLENDFGTDES